MFQKRGLRPFFVGALCTWLACGSASADGISQSANYLIEACRILANGSKSSNTR